MKRKSTQEKSDAIEKRLADLVMPKMVADENDAKEIRRINRKAKKLDRMAKTLRKHLTASPEGTSIASV